MQMELFDSKKKTSPKPAEWGRILAEEASPANSAQGSWTKPLTLFNKMSDIGKRKRLGQFLTPPEVAILMAAWVLKGRPKQILDPSVGLGIFPWAISREALDKYSLEVIGIDIDPTMISAAKHLLSETGGNISIHLEVGDFLCWRENKSFDAVIANPPYIRHHVAKLDKEVLNHYSRLIGQRLSGLTNIYGLFMIEICKRLKEDGRAAILVPAEFLNADFGVALKRFLLNEGYLRSLVIFDHSTDVFGESLSTACITLIEKSARKRRSLEVFHVNEMKDVQRITESVKRGNTEAFVKIPLTELDVERKWHSVGRENSGSPGAVLGDYLRSCRGIATGANIYFTLSRREVEQYKLPRECIRTCVTKSAHIDGVTFDDEKLSRLIDTDKKIFLLDVVRGFEREPAVSSYLRYGESLEFHKRFLTRHRDPWYSMEKRKPAPIWVTVFGRKEFRFIRNYTKALNLTTFHCLYARPKFNPDLIDAMMAYLTSSYCKEVLLEQMRVYGGGLKKLEPKDVMRIPVPKFDKLSESLVQELKEHFRRYSRREVALKKLDEVVAKICGI